MKSTVLFLIAFTALSLESRAQDPYRDLKRELSGQESSVLPPTAALPTVQIKKETVIEASPEPLPEGPSQVYVTQQQVIRPQPVIENSPYGSSGGSVVGAPMTAEGLNLRQQPLTLVESVPVEESPADKLRKSRMNFEQETENKLVEKLETERLNDEQKRREAILEKLSGAPKPEVAPIVEAPAPPVPVVVEAAPSMVPVAAPVVQELTTEAPKPSEEQEEKPRFYIGVQGGVGSFTEVDNINEGGILGAVLGIRFPNHFLAEFGYTHVKYDIDRVDSPFVGEITELEENAFGLGIKYQFLQETVRPVAGLSMTYRTRSYNDDQYYFQASDPISTTGLDFGLEGGLDFALNESFSIGATFKYFINLYNHTDSDGFYDNQYADFVGATDTEDLNYWHFGMNAKVFF